MNEEKKNGSIMGGQWPKDRRRKEKGAQWKRGLIGPILDWLKQCLMHGDEMAKPP